MIISLNWLKKFTDIDMSVSDLATLIGARLVEIEQIVDLGVKYDKIVVVKVVEASKLDGSDHLSLVKVDDGGVTPDVERDENGLVQVVCGAPNIATGQTVVWLPPGAIVPETFDDKEPFLLGSRKLCGAVSNGMIASAKELALFDEHEGILVADDEIAAGELFATAYELNDYLLDIENKSLTHRPDCFGIIGFAREVAAITGKKFETPDWLLNVEPDFDKPSDEVVELTVGIDDPKMSNRYQAIVMSGVDASRQSPLMTQIYLARVGVRPINAVVDVTNYLMMLTGQPLHAFDYDKLVAASGGKADIHVRSGNDGESLTLLDGRKIELMNEDIVISAGEAAIGLAGAMGGIDTEIDDNTKNIVIESATFNLYNLRATQMRHGIFSEAITRFTKGQPAELTAPVLFTAVEMMKQWSGAKCVSNVAEVCSDSGISATIETSSDLINDILGSNFTIGQITTTLQNAEFKIDQNDDKIVITAPYWRSDVHIVEDIIEEVGRLNGFDSINPVLPRRDFVAVRPSGFDEFRGKLRQVLVGSGANEVLNYSFIHGDIMTKAGQRTDNSYRIINSISPELQYYRQSLMPSLLGLVHPNIKQGFDKFALFEINKSHKKQDGLNTEAVPVETEAAALVVASKNGHSGAAYYQAKYILDYLTKRLGLDLIYKPIESEMTDSVSVPFEYRRSALIVDRISDSQIGIIGEYKKSVTKGFKLPDFVAGFEVDTRAMFVAYEKLGSDYRSIGRYPSSVRDICFQIKNDVDYSRIVDSATEILNNLGLDCSISPVDIYQTEDSEVKNITIRIKFSAFDRTLVSDEIATIVGKVITAVVADTDARVI